MGNIFDIKDKTNRVIFLSKERWSHIISQTSPHAYMSSYLEEIKETLINPDKMFRYSNKANYYKFIKIKNSFLKLIVRYLNGNGFIITSYLVKKISK